MIPSPGECQAQSWGGGSLINSKALLSPTFNAASVSGGVVVINEQTTRSEVGVKAELVNRWSRDAKNRQSGPSAFWYHCCY